MTASQVRISIQLTDAAPIIDISFDGLEIHAPEPATLAEIPEDTGEAHTVTVSGPSLTPRQRDVLAGLAKGQPTKAIARTLDVAEGTVRAHLKTIYKALRVENRTQAGILGKEILAKQ